jgi:hypothetical protein
MCTGVVQQPKVPGQGIHPDPLCPHPNLGAAGHDWLSIANPASNFFRKVILSFWAKECASYAAANPRPDQREVRVEDLPMIKRNELKRKLEQELVDNESLLHDSLGFTIHLRFEKPLPATFPQPQQQL